MMKLIRTSRQSIKNSLFQGSGFRALADSGSTVSGSRFRVQVQGFRGYGLWFMVYGLWFMVYGLWFMVYGVWFMVYGRGFMV